MLSKFNSVFAIAAATLISFGSFGMASAATLEVAGVSGSWTALFPPTGPTRVSGIGTKAVSWGTPYGRGGRQSGYSFVGAAAGALQTNTEFDLGTFTHNNFVIVPGTSITGAGLTIAVDLMINGASRVVNTAFNFAHLETTNNGERNGRCADGGARGKGVNAAGCADRVTLLDNTTSDQSFEVDGFLYILEITGFIRDGQAFTEFWTQENASNSAILRAKFTLVGPVNPPPPPPPSPVPLPAAGWMVLTGLGALAATRARRKS